MMIQWSEDFKTGIEVIDEHHEGMFERINELLNALDRGEEVTTIRTMIIFFESFLASHFTLEEMLLKKFECPDFLSHYNHHRWLTEYFSSLTRLIETGETTTNFVTASKHIIMGWWNAYTSHLNSLDKLLAEFLKNQI